MMRIPLLIYLLFPVLPIAAQPPQYLFFEPVFGGKSLVLGQYYPLKNGDSLQVETFRFYISNLRLLYHGHPVFIHPRTHLLIDSSDPSSLAVRYDLSDGIHADALAFELGVDSLTQSKGAQGGDLDPLNGMYWSWQSGYISAKIEGKASYCPAKGQLFQLHLGGYRAPWNTQLPLTFNLKDPDSVHIRIALDIFFTYANLQQTYAVMRPGAEAVSLVQQLGSAFGVKP